MNPVGKENDGAMVPIYAFVPGAEGFTGTMQITEIPIRIAQLMGITDFPAKKAVH